MTDAGVPATGSTDLVKDFQELGCCDESKCALATFVYLDLQEHNQLHDLEKLYDEDLDMLYFRGKRDGTPEVIIPKTSSHGMNMLEFEEVQRKLSGDAKCVTVAICEPTSTILYYSVINDFKET